MRLRDHEEHNGVENWSHGGLHGVGRAWWALWGWESMIGATGQRAGAMVAIVGLEGHDEEILGKSWGHSGHHRFGRSMVGTGG